MADERRIQSFREFFPYYLGEHRQPTCRALHFVGTAGFMVVVLACLVTEPARFGPALAGIGLLGFIGSRIEPHRNAAPLLLAMVALGIWAEPWLLAGVVWAYLLAWVAHFKVEHNKPATFTYPLWSLLGDFKMWGLMARGKIWSGDPLVELELEAPSE